MATSPLLAYGVYQITKGQGGLEAILSVITAVVVVVVIFPLWFLIWNGIMHHVGGWRKLARSYSPAAAPAGTTWRAYGAIGKMLQNTLQFTANETGLGVARCQIFDRFNKQLFIPWKDFSGARPGHSYTAHPMVTLDIGHPVQSRLLLPRYILEQSPGKDLLRDLPAPEAVVAVSVAKTPPAAPGA